MSWNTDEEKMLCLIVLDDDIGQAISPIAGDAFFRAFILENRKTGVVSCKFRFRYKDHDSWYEITPGSPKSRAERVTELQEGMEKVISQTLARRIGIPKFPPNLLVSHFPPDDEGDPQKTIEWLLAKDLIVKKEYKPA